VFVSPEVEVEAEDELLCVETLELDEDEEPGDELVLEELTEELKDELEVEEEELELLLEELEEVVVDVLWTESANKPPAAIIMMIITTIPIVAVRLKA
jgi:hypothetical protein